MTPDLVPIAVTALMSVAIIGILVAASYSRIGRSASGSRRVAAIAATGSVRQRAGRNEETKRADIEKALREIEQKQKSASGARPSLLVRMRQADLDWSRSTYTLISLLTAVAAFVLVFSGTGAGQWPALGFGGTAGLLVPHFYVSYLRSRRFSLFTKEFPNAIDIIARGVKSGLPVVDCLRIISLEAQEPVKGEFREIIEDQALGLPLDQSVQRLPERIPLAEARFFAIVIAMQSRTGGNLADALGSLSKVLRERQKMRAKISAVSAEAKTSAGIIASLPVAVSGMMHLIAPEYMDILFTSFAGKVLIAGCAIWMAIGAGIMWKMIRFDF